MSCEQDQDDLARHESEIAARQSFNYALLDDAETALPGWFYIDPPGEVRCRHSPLAGISRW